MIRRATIADAAAIARLEQQCFSVPWSEKQVAEGLACQFDTYLVLEADGRIPAYGALRTLAGESELMRIAVSPNWQRRGYARELLECMAVISREKQADCILLEVRAANAAARNLYITYGFREEGCRRGYYQHPADDAILMRLSLV